MSEWQEVYLNEAFDIGSGLSKPAEDFGSGFPFLSFKEIFNNFFIPEELPELVESSEDERDKCSVKKGDVFLTRTSETVKELGMSCVALKDYKNATFNGFTKRLRPNGNFEIVPEYAGYYFRSSKFRNEVTALSSASTRASLNNEMLGRLKIVLPSRIEQANIAAVLICLDRKIENLRKQNETLETIAQTLFKHWFVDFEFPNKDGKPYKSSGGEMVRSELGEIPVSWQVHKLGNVVKKSNTGADAIQKAPIVEKNTGIRCLRVGDLTNNRLFEDWGYCEVTQKNFEQYRLRKNDILVTRTSSLGLNLLITHDLPAIFNNGLIRINFHENVNQVLIYCFLQSRRFKEHIGKITYETSTRPNMQINYLLDFPILEVDKNIEKEFSDLVSKTLSKIDSNKRQIQTLIKTRDVLLPQLMSGKLRITE